MNEMQTLEHNFLVAMPTLENGWFEKTVIYMVEDNKYGSMGLVVNLPNKLDMADLLDHFSLPQPDAPSFLEKPVLIGGPVDLERGFILHKGEGEWKSSLPLPDQLNMTVSEDLLADISDNNIPDKLIVCLGFAGWEPGQLAEEIQQNSWITIPYNESLMFETPIEARWQVALGTLGISPEFLSAEAGNA